MAETKYMTRSEMYHWYIANEYDDCMSFEEYMRYCEKNNVLMKEDEPCSNGLEWISAATKHPPNFISVLGHMTDAGLFPAVRECYTVGNIFYFPALSGIHPVDYWREMPEYEEATP